MLFPGLVFEVSDHTGVFLGYLHKNCFLIGGRKTPAAQSDI